MNRQRQRASCLGARLEPVLLALAARALMLWLMLWAATPAWALEDDQYQPMYIEADAAEFDEKQSTSLYIGNVEVTQGSLRIQADEMLVHHASDRRIEKIIAIGQPVHYRQRLDDDPDEVTGHALRMEYEAEREELTLIDEAVLIQAQDRFASDRIVYNRITERVTAGTSAQGRERVKIRLEPESAPEPVPEPAPAQ
ncbi:lipopolysaccharide transport periplasmic protein LptA [Halochromatium salexigens]|uniref:Lipopolysaccharide export system protein LptA n=1 Tax=Halochromatium salexigens TaxID=49447 RepID=A0AAJ0XHH9_HALSE|nr:lipopolysaccharide transport periplasmic protein LptA [Halochromatium salexigens]MBK5931637.1 lipopolysaccharide transport periplasmic protein LptA [Halochromatium salexigens]